MAYSYSTWGFFNGKPTPDNREERFLRVCRARLARMAVLSHPGFEINTESGYTLHVFGLTAGPNMGLENVSHDLAHIVEFGDNAYRKRADGSGSLRFKTRRIFVYDRYCKEPRTGETSLREARTFGIQRRINERLGIKQLISEYEDEMLGACKWLPDHYFYNTEEDKQKLVDAMRHAYATVTDEVIDRRLAAWFDSALRTKKRWSRDEAKKALHRAQRAVPVPAPAHRSKGTEQKELAAA